MSSAVAATEAAVSASGSAPARTRVPSERLAVSLAAVSSTVIGVVVASGSEVVVLPGKPPRHGHHGEHDPGADQQEGALSSGPFLHGDSALHLQ